MENFNLNSNINIQRQIPNTAPKPAGLVNSASNQVQAQNQAPDNPNFTNQNQAQQVNYQANFQNINYEALTMDKEALLKYLQNLLNLPNSIDKFIDELKNNPKNAKLLAQIINENLVNVKALNQFLNENSTSAIQKLYEAISFVLKTGSKDITQLKEALSILTMIQNNTNLNPNSIKEFLLLYLPLNISVQDFKNDNGFNDSEDSKKENSDFNISIMLQTVNFSNLLCRVVENKNQLFVDISTNNLFPFERFSKIILEASKELNLNSSIEKQNLTNKDNIKDNTTDKKQSFSAATNGSLPVNVLILSHLIIKTVFKLDNDFSLI